jgi:NAD(P)-dependent dehydrogenase (short-subunit alcohol dehydrogenase family)
MSILVTGAAGGIGSATCARLCAEGARVTAVDRDPAGLARLRESLPDRAEVQELRGDTGSNADAERVVATAIARFGSLDSLVSLAGGSGRAAGDGPVDSCTDEGWTWTIEANLTSHFRLARAATPALLASRRASIVFIGSVLGRSGGGRSFATHGYAAAKAGIDGLARAMASYYAEEGLRVNVLAPGLVATPMSARAQGDPAVMEEVSRRQPLGGIVAPEAVAGSIAYLVSEDAAGVTGEVLGVDGGWRVR